MCFNFNFYSKIVVLIYTLFALFSNTTEILYVIEAEKIIRHLVYTYVQLEF